MGTPGVLHKIGDDLAEDGCDDPKAGGSRWLFEAVDGLEARFAVRFHAEKEMDACDAARLTPYDPLVWSPDAAPVVPGGGGGGGRRRGGRVLRARGGGAQA